MSSDNMNTTRIDTTRLTAAALAAIMAISAVVCFIPGISADEAEPTHIDLGRRYSNTIQFVFAGDSASGITWEFGDGTTSTEWNPVHTYASTGVYHGTQTVTNDYNGGSSAVMTFDIEIMGYPVVTFDVDGGSSVESIRQTAYKVPATAPAAPTKEGYTFAGWYSDAELTQPVNWSSDLTEHVTYHAKWTPVASDDGSNDESNDTPEQDELVLYGIAAAGAVALLAGLFTRRLGVLAVAVALLALAIASFTGVI